MAKLTERLKHYAKYTLGAYADSLMTIPLWAAEKFYQAADAIDDIGSDGNNIPGRSWNEVKEHTPFYKNRQTLRDKLDTEPGMKYLQSNAASTIPFIIIGMPAAELTQAGVDEYLSKAPEIAQYVGISLGTLAFQMTFAYGFFIFNEIRVNKEKYTGDNGKLSTKKVTEGLVKTLKTFLKFDLTYIASKTALQAYFLYNGEDAWKASAFADSLAFPAWWTLTVPMGLAGGLIEAKAPKTEQ